ncbi:MAG: hypothetical protein MI700_14765, partial [Balneolales bacterium]|nr:hypothetical protein [Balneolales bacterium]
MRRAIRAVVPIFLAKELMTSSSCADSQLKQKISLLRAMMISSSLFPTPAKAISEGAKPVAQNDSNAIYVTKRVPEDRLIDWNWSAEQVH